MQFTCQKYINYLWYISFELFIGKQINGFRDKIHSAAINVVFILYISWISSQFLDMYA